MARDPHAIPEERWTSGLATAAKAKPTEEVPTAPPPRNLWQKLLAVMEEVGWIPKRAYNAFDKYHFATEADVSEEVRLALVKHGVMVMPTLVSQTSREKTKSTITAVVMRYRFVDVDNPDESVELDMPGEGEDGGDKGSYKAITGATKYALMKMFLIPTGDDPERDDSAETNGAKPTDVITPEQCDILTDLIDRTHVELVKFLAWAQVENVADLPADRYGVAKSMLERKGANS